MHSSTLQLTYVKDFLVTTIGLHKNNTHKLHFASKVQKAIKKQKVMFVALLYLLPSILRLPRIQRTHVVRNACSAGVPYAALLIPAYSSSRL
jgi:hypothetical protein